MRGCSSHTRTYRATLPKGPSRAVFSTQSGSVVFYYRVVNVLRIVIHYSKYSKSVQNVVIHCIFSGASLHVVHSLRLLFLVCRGPLGMPLSSRALERFGAKVWGAAFF